MLTIQKYIDSNHVDDKTEDAQDAEHSNSMEIENNLSGEVDESKKSAEEIAECKQQ